MDYTLKDLHDQLYRIFDAGVVNVTFDAAFTWVNFQNVATGIHCEFYPCGKSGILSASYTVDGEEQYLDIDIMDDAAELERVINQILGV